MLKKKIWANFQKIIELFTQKIVTKLLKIWLWDKIKPLKLRCCSIQCCGSGMFIPDPDFYPYRIPDLGSQVVKKNLLSYLF
jgi:hypothetical protein